jgi:hypothetical protein
VPGRRQVVYFSYGGRWIRRKDVPMPMAPKLFLPPGSLCGADAEIKICHRNELILRLNLFRGHIFGRFPETPLCVRTGKYATLLLFTCVPA